jgi:hypothetical protein
MSYSEKVYYNSAGTVSDADYGTSFDDTLIGEITRDTENDNRPEVTRKYTCVHPHSCYDFIQSLYKFLTSQYVVQKIN